MTTDFILLLEQILGVAALGFGLGLVIRYIRIISEMI